MDNELDNASEMLADLPWQLLEEITNGFSEEQRIGSGGYGVVYKGVYKNGEEIAVKKLYHMPGLDDKQFQNELQTLTRLHHQNIVRLVGKSYEEKERCVEYEGKLVCAKMIDRVICLEYLHNGSLEKHLSDESSGLPWHRRYEIIKGICDGLKYLHERGIFHLDLKPANILLDKNMVPKIADFGLSRLFSGTRQSHTTSKFLGTLGYVPPEYIEKGKISEKFDVFSLGVIIIGIMTGPDGYSKQADMSSQDFTNEVLENWSYRPQEQWKDESYFDVFYRPQEQWKDKSFERQVKMCVEIALNCVETDRHKRPSIGDIICKLNESETCKVLARGYFCTIDVHPTEPWILTNHGYTGIQIFNYQAQATVKSFRVGNIFGCGRVKTAKFIARKQWFVVGEFAGSIHVYCYRAMQKVKSLVAHSSPVTCFAIHPTEPYVLSASLENIILWDWEKCWECTRIFEISSRVKEIAFNPKDTNSFATGYVDGRAKIWNLGSPDSSFTLGEKNYTACMLDYFASGDRQYLITACSNDYTAKIWDLQKKSCIKTLRHKTRVTAVCSHPELPILMTAAEDGTVYLWNSTTFRVQSTFNFGLGGVFAFGCIKGSRRVVIGHDEGLTMMEIDHNEEPVANTGGVGSGSGRRGLTMMEIDHNEEPVANTGGGGSGSGSRGHSPQLECRNAAKHIDYEAGAGASSMSACAVWSSSSSLAERSLGLHPSRSLDLAAGGGGTDFRINGNGEAEVDELCRSLGLSGPDEFAIPIAAWEAYKARSNSNLLPCSRLISLPPVGDPSPVARLAAPSPPPRSSTLRLSPSLPPFPRSPPLVLHFYRHRLSTSTATDSAEETTTPVARTDQWSPSSRRREGGCLIGEALILIGFGIERDGEVPSSKPLGIGIAG